MASLNLFIKGNHFLISSSLCFHFERVKLIRRTGIGLPGFSGRVIPLTNVSILKLVYSGNMKRGKKNHSQVRTDGIEGFENY